MPEEKAGIKINISGGKEGPGKGLTKVVVLEPAKFNLIGKKVGEVFNGALVGLPGYEIKICGGSDSSGIPISKTRSWSYQKTHFIIQRSMLSSTPERYEKTQNCPRQRTY